MSRQPPELLTVAEFARRAGCLPKQVYRAIENGKISRDEDKLIDAVQLLGQWRKPNRRTVMRREETSGAGAAATGDAADPGDEGLLSTVDALKLKENYLARRQRLEFDIKVGSVVVAADVAKIVGAEYARVRSRLLAIPTERAPEVHRLRTVAEVEDRLRSAIVEALWELAGDREPAIA